MVLSYPAVSSLIQHSMHESGTPFSSPAGDQHEQMVEQLIDWIVANSDYKDFGHPRPNIIRANQAFMDNLWVELNNGAKASGTIGAMHVWSPLADDENKSTIYIPIYFNINYDLDKKMLVHELVHHLQRWNGTIKTVECHNKLEYDAYMLSAKYLKAIGYENYKVIRSNEKYARIKSECSTANNSKYNSIPKPDWFGKL